MRGHLNQVMYDGRRHRPPFVGVTPLLRAELLRIPNGRVGPSSFRRYSTHHERSSPSSVADLIRAHNPFSFGSIDLGPARLHRPRNSEGMIIWVSSKSPSSGSDAGLTGCNFDSPAFEPEPAPRTSQSVHDFVGKGVIRDLDLNLVHQLHGRDRVGTRDAWPNFRGLYRQENRASGIRSSEEAPRRGWPRWPRALSTSMPPLGPPSFEHQVANRSDNVDHQDPTNVQNK